MGFVEDYLELVAQLVDDVDLTTLTYGSQKSFRWKCEHGHAWKAIISGRVNGVGCPMCNRNKRSGIEREFIETVRNLIGDDIDIRACVIDDGLSCLLNFAKEKLEKNGNFVNRWISFSYCDTSLGIIWYNRCGFYLDRELPPDDKYAGNITGGYRIPKEAFQVSQFRNDFNLSWDSAWSESKWARENDLFKCYDSGKLRWMKSVV